MVFSSSKSKHFGGEGSCSNSRQLIFIAISYLEKAMYVGLYFWVSFKFSFPFCLHQYLSSLFSSFIPWRGCSISYFTAAFNIYLPSAFFNSMPSARRFYLRLFYPPFSATRLKTVYAPLNCQFVDKGASEHAAMVGCRRISPGRLRTVFVGQSISAWTLYCLLLILGLSLSLAIAPPILEPVYFFPLAPSGSLGSTAFHTIHHITVPPASALGISIDGHRGNYKIWTRSGSFYSVSSYDQFFIDSFYTFPFIRRVLFYLLSDPETFISLVSPIWEKNLWLGPAYTREPRAQRQCCMIKWGGTEARKSNVIQ